MKRGKKLCLLLLVLVLVCCGVLVARNIQLDDTQDQVEEGNVTPLSVDPDSVTGFSWLWSGETDSFTRTQDGWFWTEDDAFPVNGDLLDNMLSEVCEFEATKTIVEPEDLDEYGFDEPEAVVTITADSVVEISFGDETAMGGERYVSIGDGNVYLVEDSLLDAFTCGLYGTVEMETIPAMGSAESLTIDTAADRHLEIVLDEDGDLAYSDTFIWFARDGKSYVPLDTGLVDTLLANMTGLSWLECVDYKGSGAVSDYGFDEPTTVCVGYTATDEDGNTSEESFTLELGSETDEGRYARVYGSGMVYIISASTGSKLIAATLDGLLPTQVLSMNWEEVTRFEATLDGETHVFESCTETVTDDDGNEEEDEYWTLDGEREDSAEDVLDSIDSLSSAGSGAGETSNLAQELGLVFYQKNAAWPKVEVSILRYDGENCLVLINGEASFLTPRSDVIDLTESINTLILG